MPLIGYGLPVLLVLVAAWIGLTFNRFIRLKNMTREAWSGVEVQLKRRHDLIPLLAASVKAYRDYEAAVLETLARVRSAGQSPDDVSKASQTETDVTRTLRTLLAVAETARQSAGATRVLALLDARMGEVYSAAYVHGTGDWLAESDIAVGPPEALAAPPGDGWALAGNAFAEYAGRLPPALHAWPRIDALPTAAALLDLAPALLAAGRAVPADQALPLYIRNKVAQTTAERAAAAR